MIAKTIRRTLLLALLAFGATACADSSLLAPDCVDAGQCEYIPDSGSLNGQAEAYIPDSGS